MLLSVNNLSIEFQSKSGLVSAVKNISFEVNANEMVGLVGESGSGKSVTALSILRLIDAPGKISSGSIVFEGRDLLKLQASELQKIRGNQIAMIFQDPYGSLNPVYSVGSQIVEVLMLHQSLAKPQALQRAVELLEWVQIPAASKRVHDYPHQFSGGMCQRVMIAMALACNPKLLIADEPTTALDVTIQAEILQLLADLQAKTQMGVLLISHDLGLISQMCGRVLVMHEGQIVEQGSTQTIYQQPQHAYTQKLLASIPKIRY